jgi:hypothetical protein
MLGIEAPPSTLWHVVALQPGKRPESLANRDLVDSREQRPQEMPTLDLPRRLRARHARGDQAEEGTLSSPLQPAHQREGVVRRERREVSLLLWPADRVLRRRWTKALKERLEDLAPRRLGHLGERRGFLFDLRLVGRGLAGRGLVARERRPALAASSQRPFAGLFEELAPVRGEEAKQVERRFRSLGHLRELLEDRPQGVVDHREPVQRVTLARLWVALEELPNAAGEATHEERTIRADRHSSPSVTAVDEDEPFVYPPVAMAAKKTSTKRVNKTAFVRSLPSSMPGAEVVKKAKEAGLKISVGYVYSIRAKTHAKKRSSAPAAAAPPAKRGPGRPRKAPSSTGGGSNAIASRTAGGLVAEIEAIVERKVTELLKQRLGALFG